MEAYITLGFMRAAILRVSFRRLTQSMNHSTNKEKCIPVTDAQLQTATTIGRVIDLCATHTPWESTCLAQSLTAQRMLKKRGIPGAFYLGAAKDEKNRGKIEAHSWSKCGTYILTGKKGHERFTILSAFEWGTE